MRTIEIFGVLINGKTDKKSFTTDVDAVTILKNSLNYGFVKIHYIR